MAGPVRKPVQAFVQQVLRPEAALHRVPDKLENGQMQLAGQPAEPRVLEERLAAAVAGDDHDAFHGSDFTGQPKIKLNLLLLALAFLSYRLAPLLVADFQVPIADDELLGRRGSPL